MALPAKEAFTILRIGESMDNIFDMDNEVTVMVGNVVHDEELLVRQYEKCLSDSLRLYVVLMETLG